MIVFHGVPSWTFHAFFHVFLTAGILVFCVLFFSPWSGWNISERSRRFEKFGGHKKWVNFEIRKEHHDPKIIGFLRGGVGCPRGGGNWGTLRIPREDWGTEQGTLGKITGITPP